ncbi:MSC_0624 family F1-like ATPase-associated membrane protein [Mycoplasmopsis meleagridis]|uniref:MSC_0624 family F1-like ATPase-associated membrane protein n=1 Tax=Mycoplasmopsis meleagridis TaxID=29561 RepID=UPI00073D462F|nr:hypothetical protein [Mycoplasmopsis meleagridis]KUH47474.1 hypothetical protein ASB56_01240 [Mycoplasmopsis meleagridis]
MQTLAPTKKKILQFNFSKENILKFVSLLFLFLASLAFGFVIEHFIKVLTENKLISYETLFDTSLLSLKSLNLYIFFNITLFGLLIIIATMKSYFLINRNNLRFSHYITWYVLYLLFALAALILFSFSFNIDNNTPAKTLLNNSFIVIPLLVIDISYEIFNQHYKNKLFHLKILDLSLEIVYIVVKALLVGLSFYVLSALMNNRSILTIFINNQALNEMNTIFINNHAYFNWLIFGIIFIAVLLIGLRIYVNRNKIKNIILRKKTIYAFIKMLCVLCVAVAVFAIYDLIIYRSTNYFLSESINKKLIDFIIVISLIALVNLIVFVLYLIKGLGKYVKYQFTFWIGELVSLFLVLVGNILLNNDTRLIISITSSLLFVINYITLIVFKRPKDNFIKNVFLSLTLLFIVLSLLFNILIYISIINNNYSILTWSDKIDLSIIFAIVALLSFSLIIIIPQAYELIVKFIMLVDLKKKVVAKKKG